MKRGDGVPRFFRYLHEDGSRELMRLEEGDEEAHRLAAALAEVSTADFVRSVLNGKCALDSIGGEITISADRRKYDSTGSEVHSDDAGHRSEKPGYWETSGYVVNYEAVSSVKSPKEPTNNQVREVELPEVAERNGDEPVEIGDDVPEEELEQPPENEPVPEEAEVEMKA